MTQQRQLVQDASHELRTPLTSLRANSELLERSDISAETRSSILRDMRADKPHVFDRFYRAAVTRALPGSGLGLAIVAQFADDHDATTFVTDTVGGGATVGIEFK